MSNPFYEEQKRKSRSKYHVLILFGAPLGYIGSYFAQSGFLRIGSSLGDYIASIGSILAPSSKYNTDNPFGRMAENFQTSVAFTAWVGIVVGLILMGILVVLWTNRKD